MKLASIEIVTQIHHHPDADRLELAQVLGWQVVVAKGAFKPGDRAVLVVIDSLIPRASWSEFLFKDRKPSDTQVRLHTVRLRGQYSQGLLLPLSILEGACEKEWRVGSDVSAALGIKKYEKEVPVKLSGIIKGKFPLHAAPRTDEDNAFNDPVLVKTVVRNKCEATLKLDGSSFTGVFERGALVHVCSRDVERADSDTDPYWQVARHFTALGQFTGIIQGELMGPGIQGNQLELIRPRLHVYQVFREGSGWMSYEDMALFVCLVGEGKVDVVPLVQRFDPGVSLAYLQVIADSAKLPNGRPAEGLVVRPVVPQVYRGKGRPLGFKILNREYDLK